MSSRIGTAFAAQQSIDLIGQRSATAAKLQQQIATGSRLQSAADDPAAAAQAERLRASNAQSALDRRMMGFAQTALGTASGALDSGVDVLQSARDLMVQANNGSYGPDDRALAATQLQGMRDQLLSVANQADGGGGFVFGGQGATQPPFSAAGAPAFQAAAGTQQTGIGMGFDTTVDGAKVFLGDGGAGSTGSVFKVLDAAIAQLRDPAATSATTSAGISAAMSGVDATLQRMNLARTSVGEQMRAIDSRTKLLESGEMQTTARMSALTDTDYAKAISDLTQNQTGQEAAMRTYAQISRLSLFNYLG